MSQENVEIVRSIYERWDRDPAANAEAARTGDGFDDVFALDLFDPAVEIRQNPAVLDTAGVFHGHEGLRRAAQELHGAFGTLEWVPERWTDKGEWIVVWVRVVGVGQSSGIQTNAAVAHAWCVRDGRITHFQVYQSEEEALEAAGLRE